MNLSQVDYGSLGCCTISAAPRSALGLLGPQMAWACIRHPAQVHRLLDEGRQG
jgi:hypothetical protein